jgi:DHA1 family bicyclomycin/chloramphenicol resistance-like MFS transporter
MTAAAPADAYRTPWAMVILLGSLTAFAAISIDMYLPSLPSISAGYHVAPGAAQATLATFFAGLAIGQFFHGPASDRWGRRIPLFAGVALYVAASAWCALSPSLPMLCLARFFQALGGCAGPVIARAIVRDRFEHRQSARILSQLMLVMGVAPILAPLAGAGMLAFGGWPTIFWFLAGFGTVVGVWMFFALGESRSHETARQARGENPLAAYWALLRQRRLVGYMLAGALNSAALFAYLAASPSLLIGTYHIPASQFGLVFGVNAMGLIGMSQVNAHLLRNHSPESILVRSRIASILCAAVLALDAYTGWGGMWGVLIPLFFVLASFGLVGANTQAAGLNIDPTRAGSISALMGGASFGSAAVVSALTGVLHDGTARPMASVILVAIVASAAALYGVARPMARAAASVE